MFRLMFPWIYFLLSQAAHECLAQMITEVDKLFLVSRIPLSFKFYQQFFSVCAVVL